MELGQGIAIEFTQRIVNAESCQSVRALRNFRRTPLPLPFHGRFEMHRWTAWKRCRGCKGEGKELKSTKAFRSVFSGEASTPATRVQLPRLTSTTESRTIALLKPRDPDGSATVNSEQFDCSCAQVRGEGWEKPRGYAARKYPLSRYSR